MSYLLQKELNEMIQEELKRNPEKEEAEVAIEIIGGFFNFLDEQSKKNPNQFDNPNQNEDK